MANVGRILLVMLCVLCFTATAFPDWRIYKKADLRDKKKNTLRIDRTAGGKVETVHVWFLLRKKKSGVFSSKTPLYQVDDGPVHDLASVHGRMTDKKAERWIRWQIWDGKGAVPPDLLEIMNGKSFVFQYYLSSGEIKETTFLLDGAKEAIEEVLK